MPTECQRTETELNWIELNWTELNWIVLNCTELNWMLLGRTETDYSELNAKYFSFYIKSLQTIGAQTQY